MRKHMDDEEISVEAVSKAFDCTYYRRRYADIADNPAIDGFAHYCQIGWREGRDPNDWFSTRLYLLAHLDVAAAKLNPLIHYVLRGKRANYTIFKPLPPSPQEALLPPEAEYKVDSSEFEDVKAHLNQMQGGLQLRNANRPTLRRRPSMDMQQDRQ